MSEINWKVIAQETCSFRMRNRKLGGKCTEVCAVDFKVKSQKICERVEVDIQ